VFAGLCPDPVLLNGLNTDEDSDMGAWSGRSFLGSLWRMRVAYERLEVVSEIARRDGTINFGEY
jgi:hypothetical protein